MPKARILDAKAGLSARAARAGARAADERGLSRHERAVTAFEYALWHLGSAFARWRRDCLAYLPNADLSGAEASILHIIHMNSTAKGLSDISRLLHRDDLSNIQYGLKKLLAHGLIEKADPRAPRKTVTYKSTRRGAGIVEAYLKLRRDVLLKLTARMVGATDAIENATTLMHVMIGIYDQAGNVVVGHHGAFGNLQP
ncbi:MAG: winged helix DNA-binding protein [Alphaproteobacteria bacterium]